MYKQDKSGDAQVKPEGRAGEALSLSPSFLPPRIPKQLPATPGTVALSLGCILESPGQL